MINVHLQLYSPMETILLHVVSHEEVEYCITGWERLIRTR